ncbi:hypothetical protein [Vacuolonema iberomarrocanum]|uniref:hypothetical protein n=1 Tax=Vacuolonema iberomarrocanum TaxID=3454632 RepID=UPI0019EF74A8|nr:hypothetical protein [filamentous cyanobacterium LEGE 07170]
MLWPRRDHNIVVFMPMKKGAIAPFYASFEIFLDLRILLLLWAHRAHNSNEFAQDDASFA